MTSCTSGVVSPVDAHAEIAPPPFDFEKAFRILQHYRRKRDGEPVPRGGRPPPYATREQTNEALLKALDWVEKRTALEGGGDG